MEKEGLDLAVMYPSIGLGVMMREDMDPKLGAAGGPGLQQLAP